MRILTFTPGIARPCIQHIAPERAVLCRLMGGPLAVHYVPQILPGAALVYACEADKPNRDVDGHVIAGTLALVRIQGGELADLPLEAAERVRDNCPWPTVQWTEAAV